MADKRIFGLVSETGLTKSHSLVVDKSGQSEATAITIQQLEDKLQIDRFVTTTSINYTNLNDNASVGTGATQVAQGNHNHGSVYEPLNANIQTHIASTTNPHATTAAQAGAVALTGTESIAGAKTFSTTVTLTKQLVSNIVTGTSPLSVASTTVNTNLNADKLDGADLDTTTTLGTSDVKIPSQNAVKVYADTKEPAFSKNTAFNKNYSVTSTDIKMNGTQALGTNDTLAHSDHVHPSDTSKMPLTGGTFTGAVTDNNSSNRFNRFAQWDVIDRIKANVTDSNNIERLCFFDETGATTTIKDRCYNRYSGGTDATLSANASTLSPSISGMCRNLNLTSNAYFEFADADDLSFGNGTTDDPFSIVALINPNSSSGELIAKRDSTTGSEKREWEFLYYSNTLYVFLFDNSASSYIGVLNAIGNTSGSFNVYAQTYNGSGSEAGLKLYLNGSYLTPTSNSTGSYTAMENLGAKAGNYRISTAGAKERIGNAKYGFLMIIREELADWQVTNITNALMCYAGQDYAWL